MHLNDEECLILCALIPIDTQLLNTMQRLHVGSFRFHKPVNLTLSDYDEYYDILHIRKNDSVRIPLV